ncbi:hypothetical protein NL676_038647 [Syzygium grande]|nr:hypothetical protein NL676_038647 [Syzygium grande]
MSKGLCNIFESSFALVPKGWAWEGARTGITSLVPAPEAGQLGWGFGALPRCVQNSCQESPFLAFTFTQSRRLRDQIYN